MRPRIGSPRASRGVFIRPLCGMYRSTSTSRSPARAYRAPSWAGTRAEHGTPRCIEPVPGSLDGLQPGWADRRPVHAHNQLLAAAADQQVQVQAPAQVTALPAGDCPPSGKHLPRLPGDDRPCAPAAAARVIHTRHDTR